MTTKGKGKNNRSLRDDNKKARQKQILCLGRRMTIKKHVRKQVQKQIQSGLRWEGQRALLVELEDFDLDQLGDGEVLESAGFHSLDEWRVDLEDAHLDKFFLGW